MRGIEKELKRLGVAATKKDGVCVQAGSWGLVSLTKGNDRCESNCEPSAYRSLEDVVGSRATCRWFDSEM
jgi:hypothetical protein